MEISLRSHVQHVLCAGSTNGRRPGCTHRSAAPRLALRPEKSESQHAPRWRSSAMSWNVDGSRDADPVSVANGISADHRSGCLKVESIRVTRIVPVEKCLGAARVDRVRIVQRPFRDADVKITRIVDDAGFERPRGTQRTLTMRHGAPKWVRRRMSLQTAAGSRMLGSAPAISSPLIVFPRSRGARCGVVHGRRRSAMSCGSLTRSVIGSVCGVHRINKIII